MKLQNATLLITGANRGVGKAYVEEALARGAAKIYAAARDPETLGPVVALDPERVVPIRLDITDAAQIADAARTANDVTLLINNAGVLSFGGALDVAQSAIDRDMAVNHNGLRDMTRAFAPVIEVNGGGAVVNMLSLLSFLAAPGFSAYNASKAAAWSMAMSLRAYLRPRGVLVVNAFPGGIDTEMLAGIEGPKDTAQAVASAVLDGLEAGEEDVYPATAADVYAGWRADQKGLEAAFAAMM
ncbi:SDR family NAD(P)-dependent oxidoreductase [Pseudoruegeria sp. SHC-113]|uniref:SDR family NAD(P)-dependent oxidoreductase n=1 Tax=Pseudoruegeria sp. SHC-113 TaxID=2855439 RepID=UPI0021BB6A80|nr:SDR family NAD(P)-dependent oxidoreductase [Pseudoruegeria sp. SHC-113]MCT8160364.1 SDR family NAD(P)-dependent oxidoreductase [Pseudoruegeria sp. SHC-113]